MLSNKANPENCEWPLTDERLESFQTFLPRAPEILLNSFVCNCTKGCKYNCGCKKFGQFVWLYVLIVKSSRVLIFHQLHLTIMLTIIIKNA